MKDIKKLLKDSSSSILPDNQVKERIKADLTVNQPSRAVQYNNGATGNTTINNKSLIYIIVAILLVGAIVGGILLFNFGNGGIDIGDGSNNGKFDEIKTSGDFYAYGVASVGALLTSQNTATAMVSYSNETMSQLVNLTANAISTDKTSTASVSQLTPLAVNKALTDSQKEIVNGYMPLVEELLSDSKITHTESVLDESVSQYKYQMSVVYKDITGKQVEYTMYYNKELLSTNVDGDETESNYSIVGNMLIGNDTTIYPIEGKYITESETDEEESEMWFKAYTSQDKSSYIVVDKESENEQEDGEYESEVQYTYSVYENNTRVRHTVAKYEQEGKDIKLVLNVTERDGSRNRLTFKKASSNGQFVFNVSADFDGERVNFVVSIVTAENGDTSYSYETMDGSHIGDGNRYDKFDDEEDDDDDDDHDDDDRFDD